MKYKTTGKKQLKQIAPPIKTKQSALWVVVVVIGLAFIGGVLWRHNKDRKEANYSTSTPAQAISPIQADKDLLVGRWTRTDSDGAYVIEIKSAGTDGKLDARYFNPNPIKVGHAEWQNKNGNLIVVIVLRDVNYPGSTYTLNFFSSEERMTGVYYQAVQGTNFDVEFVRAK